jgi:hypothetical protein
MAQDALQPDWAKQWAQVIARAWSDEAYKQRLLGDPRAVLAEAGLTIPAHVQVQVQVHEATPVLLHMVLPPPLTDLLSDEQLDAVSGANYGGVDGADLVNQQQLLQQQMIGAMGQVPVQSGPGSEAAIAAAMAQWAAMANFRSQMLGCVAASLRALGIHIN